MKISLCFFIFLLTTSIYGQSVNFGIGLSNETQFFQHKNKAQYEPELLKPYVTNAIGLDLTIKIKRNNAFQFYTNLHFINRKIALAYKYENYAGCTRAEGVKYDFFTIDWSINAAYLIEKKWLKIEPMLGFFLSGTKYVGGSEFSKTGGNYFGGCSLGTNLLDFDFEIDENIPATIYAGITGGIVLQPIVNLRYPAEIFINLNYTPRNIFGNGILYQINFENKNLNGQPHSLTVGIRVWMRKVS